MAGHPSPSSDVLIALFSLAMGSDRGGRSLGRAGIFTTAGTFTLVAFAAPSKGLDRKSEIAASSLLLGW